MTTISESTPITTIQEAFEAAILTAPGDHTPRLVYADWLEEHDEPESAAYLRASVRRLIARAEEAKRKAKEAREQKYQDARREVALAVGQAYHARIEDLYQSKRGEVVYGRGGQEVVDWDAYGKRGYRNPNTGRKQPAKYRQAGARVVGYARSGRVVLENHRGTEKARLPLPPQGAVFSGHRGLVAGDLFLLTRQIAGQHLAIRYGLTFAKGVATGYRQTGVAVRFPVSEDCRQQGGELWSVFRTEKETYWEHGQDIAACRAEYQRKLALAEEIRTRTAHSARREQLAADLAALCPGLVVTHADRRAAGYCDAGTAGFLARHNLTGQDAIPAAQLRATGAPEVERPILLAARRLVDQAFGAN